MVYTIKFKDGSSKKFTTLSEANLRGADLSGANLRGVNLRGADLRGADLYEADLRRVNLRGADLRGADLRGADLRGADLRRANLFKANLIYTKGILSATFGKHLAIAFKFDNKVYIKIGCKCYDVETWYKDFKEIGSKNRYSENQIKHYGAFIGYIKSLKGDF